MNDSLVTNSFWTPVEDDQDAGTKCISCVHSKLNRTAIDKCVGPLLDSNNNSIVVDRHVLHHLTAASQY